VLKNE